MTTTSKLLMVALLASGLVAGAWAADYAGPKLEGTVTLRSGETISGLILTAQLGIVDGAEIGSRLRDGGYIAVKTEDGEERRVNATDVAAMEVQWAQTGTDEAPKWKITDLSITTTSGEVISGTPAWLVHATSLVIEEADGTQRKLYAFPMAGSNFSPDNLMTDLIIGEATAPPVTEVTPPATEVTPPATEVTPPATEVVPPATEVTPPAIEVMPPATEVTPPATGITPPTAPDVVAVQPETEATVTVTPVPSVEVVPEGSVFASGQPAVITFEIINPETGNPMRVRFLIVPLPAE